MVCVSVDLSKQARKSFVGATAATTGRELDAKEKSMAFSQHKQAKNKNTTINHKIEFLSCSMSTMGLKVIAESQQQSNGHATLSKAGNTPCTSKVFQEKGRNQNGQIRASQSSIALLIQMWSPLEPLWWVTWQFLSCTLSFFPFPAIQFWIWDNVLLRYWLCIQLWPFRFRVSLKKQVSRISAQIVILSQFSLKAMLCMWLALGRPNPSRERLVVPAQLLVEFVGLGDKCSGVEARTSIFIWP